jgi:hypothetical protein
VLRSRLDARVDLLVEFLKASILEVSAVVECLDLVCLIGCEVDRRAFGMPRLQSPAGEAL